MSFSNYSLATQEPDARKLLDKVRNFYEQAQSLEIQFTYEQSASDIVGLSKKGQISSKGQMFKLILDDVEIYNDGKTQYTFFKKNKEVQITESESTDNKYHPKNIAALHQSGDYQFKILKKIKEAGKLLTVVEFKSKQKTDAMTTITLYVSEQTKEIHKVNWTESNGNKTMVSFGKSSYNKVLADSSFTLNTRELKGIHIEDLRD